MSDEMKWGQENPEVPPQPKYTHYQVSQDMGSSSDGRFSADGAAQPVGEPFRRPEKKPKKRKGGFGRKLAATVALAVVFGLVAGVVFQGVNYAAQEYLGVKQQTPLGTTEILSEDEAEDSSEETDTDSENTSARNGTVASVAQAAMPAVVAITSVSIQEITRRFGLYGFSFGTQEYASTGSGSGIIVGENENELLIATNNHVVDGATTLSVCFIGNDVVNAEEEIQNLVSDDGDINVEDAVSAKIKGTDAGNDLAVIAVEKKDIPEDTMSQIKIAQIGSSESLMVGEQVVAIGNALGYGQSVTSGWVSALNRTITTEDGNNSELIQTDAAINPGNSGGALLNMRGELIGINSAKYADNAVEGMGYAIPISKAQPILEDLMNRKTRDKVEEGEAAYMGVQIAADMSSEAMKMYNMPAGAFVIETEDGEAAQQAGMQKGDIIVKLDGQIVSGRDDLLNKLQYYAAGEAVEVIVARADEGEYQEQMLQVVLGSRPSSETDE